MFRHAPVHVEGVKASSASVFTRVQPFKELLDPYAELSRCEERFVAEKIDVELAMSMTVEQLERLLPDEPLGHVLRLKQLLGGAKVLALPKDAFCTMPAR